MKGTVLALGGIFYLIFADGEVQDWAKNENENEEDDMIVKSWIFSGGHSNECQPMT